MVSGVPSACPVCRLENHKEAKRKREEIKWEPGSAQKAKKSRSDRAASRDRDHKSKHKEKCALVIRLLSMKMVLADLPCKAKQSFLDTESAPQ